MSDARARDLERRAALDPGAAAALARAHERLGTSPARRWLPVLARDAGRWRRAGALARFNILVGLIRHMPTGRGFPWLSAMRSLEEARLEVMGWDPVDARAQLARVMEERPAPDRVVPRTRRGEVDGVPLVEAFFAQAPWVDPLAEARALELALSAGITSFIPAFQPIEPP